ncbi:MAG: methyl-accepting chemotaxis protein [Oscillospiraceae bacterium]
MFKNMKIGKKLIISFVIVSLLASISGVVGVWMLKDADTKYSNALTNYGFSQGSIGKALAVFCRIDGNVHDAISYLDDAAADTARKGVEERSKTIEPYFDEIEPTLMQESTKKAFAEAKTAWKDYLAKANELIVAGDSEDATVVAKVQKRLIAELDPLYTKVYDNLALIMDDKVSAGAELSDTLTTSTNLSIIIAIVLIVSAMAISIFLGISISTGISRPVKACADRLEKLATGDLTSAVPDVKSKDETGVLANATSVIVEGLSFIILDVSRLLEEMGAGNFDVHSGGADRYIGDFLPLLTAVRTINSHLSETLSQINTASDQVSAGSDQVSSGAQALSQGATEQASSVQELAATITEISQQVKSNAENAKNASDIVNNTGSEVATSNEKMQQLIGAMNEISSSSQEIGKVIKTIEDIAFQTNILALNAAVEAARAGAAGKGFAVVADEVRNLASKSAEAAKGTTVLIEGAVAAVDRGTKLVDETAKSLQSVVNGTQEVVVTVDRISEASNEQAQSIAQVTQGVDQISSVVQTNSATAEESAAASEELSGQAQMLKDLVSKFTLKKTSAASAKSAAVKEKAAAIEHSFTGSDKY